jgi:hypothetical protein
MVRIASGSDKAKILSMTAVFIGRRGATVLIDCPRCNEGDERAIGVNVCGLCGCTFIVGKRDGDKIMARPSHRPDGVPTRNDVSLMSPAEKAITEAMCEVEKAGASRHLTDAVTLLGMARNRVADHVESINRQ